MKQKDTYIGKDRYREKIINTKMSREERRSQKKWKEKINPHPQ